MSRLSDRYSIPCDPLRTERRVELVVLLLLVLLLLQVVWGVYRIVFPSTPEPVMPTAESLQVGEAPGPELVTPEQRAEMRQRPLFWASRRPLDGEREVGEPRVRKKTGEKKPGTISGVKLSGVFGAGDSAGIIVLDEGKKRRVIVGEEIKGWKLHSVTPVEASFRSKGRKASLQLQRGEPLVIVPEEAAPVDSVEPESQEPAPPRKSSGTLGLGGGDRNRGKTTK